MTKKIQKGFFLSKKAKRKDFKIIGNVTVFTMKIIFKKGLEIPI